MTQKDKELLLKDLCARLPYGVKMNHIADNEHSTKTLIGVAKDMITLEGLGGYECVDVEDYKPYLFPLSSMTVEQRCKAQNLLPNNCEISFINSKITFYGENCCEIKLEQFDKLFKFFDSQHVDYRGLIPMGLAIDATGLNVY